MVKGNYTLAESKVVLAKLDGAVKTEMPTGCLVALDKR